MSRLVSRERLAGALASLRAWLEERFAGRLAEARLFGSHARGEPTEDSDVDVLVAVHGLTFREEMDVATACTLIAIETGVPLAPLALSEARFAELRGLERRIALDIDREGRPI